MQERILSLATKVELPTSRWDRHLAAEEIIRESEAFWYHDARTINQALHRAFGKHRFVFLGGEIIDIK